jgi:hypothetical protein
MARADESARRLTTIPGVGPLNATALVAAVGDFGSFARGRDLAAWLGLVPRQVTTAGRSRLVRIRSAAASPTQDADPRRTIRPQQHATRGLAQRIAREGACQPRPSSPSQPKWHELCGPYCVIGGSTRRMQWPPEGGNSTGCSVGDVVCERQQGDGLTVKRCSGTLSRKMAFDAAPPF